MMEAVFTLVEETKRIFDKINVAVMAIIVIREELRQRGLKQHNGSGRLLQAHL